MTEWKAYSSAELQRINDAFWQDLANYETGKADVPCPVCGANAEVLLSRAYGYPRALRVHCSACRTRGSFKSVETPGSGLPEAQLKAAVERHQTGAPAYCPSCQTILRVLKDGLGEAVIYTVHCPRCGGSGELRPS